MRPLTNPFRSTTREFDSETSLYYYRARYYDPQAGRFASEGPIHFNAGVNFYRYVQNDPIDNTDPTGFTTYKGFSPEQEVWLRDAMNKALKKLRENCPSYAGSEKETRNLINLLEKATFVYQPRSRLCGQTGPLSFLGQRHVFGLGPKAFVFGKCCKLESTMVHEAVHGLVHFEPKALAVERDCFGCYVLQ